MTEAAEPERARPNVILIMTDQQRWDSLGLTSDGRVRTPHLDKLARTGAHFPRAFVPTPLCTPSRISLLKSRYPTQHGIRANEFGPMPEPDDALPAMFKSSGYCTALIGKDHAYDAGVHFGEQAGWAQAELSRRDAYFDRVNLFEHLGRNPREGEPETASDAAVREFRKHHMQTKYLDSEPFPPEQEMTARITDMAIEFVDDAKAAAAPFFMWLSYPDPHPPFVVSEPYASMYRNSDVGLVATRDDEYEGAAPRVGVASKLMRMEQYSEADVRRIRELYFGMVTFIDDQVGRLRARLDELGLSDNTYIVFTADHGEYLGDHGMVRKSVALYDCLVRVPLIINGPSVRPGLESEFLASSLDITPTLLELAGIPDTHLREGASLAGYLSGGAAPERPYVFGTYGVEGSAITREDAASLDYERLFAHPYTWGSWVSPLVMRGREIMVRDARHKLVVHEGGFREFYDLDNDPNELKNVFGSAGTAEVERVFFDALAEWQLRHSPDLPQYKAMWP